ncbi:MAG: retron system putative HNH endonuclease [Candidatus Binatia bacterium]
MKHIQKGGPPHDYAAWCSRVKGTNEEDYRRLQNPAKANLHLSLLKEQGWLCAYTMKRIDEASSHIEHIKPESLCRSDKLGSDLDYKNMTACYPRVGMSGQCRYGAQAKGQWWNQDGTMFVSPLHPNCEKRFRFYLDGRIEAVGGGQAALNTIDVLKLDHATLTDERRRVIHEFVYGPSGADPLSTAKVKLAIQNIYTPNHGKFYEFCKAIHDALAEHLKDLERIAKRRKFSRKKK